LAVEPLLALEVKSGCFYQHDGLPVWPVRNAAERQALERIVSTLGGEVRFVSSAEPKLLTGPELVVGLGPGAHEQARLYAHLTRRCCLPLEHIEELNDVPRVAVVVTTFAHVNESLFDLLYGRDRIDRAPGVVFSYEDEDLTSQVLTRAAALYCSPASLERRRVDVNPTLDFGCEESPEYTFVGGKSDASHFREALSCAAGLLTLYTHSDGIDAYLRKDLVLCPIQSVAGGGRAARQPSCVISGICHRCRRPMSEVLGTEMLLAPDIVRAHVFIYCACWGLYPSPGVHSTEFSLSRRFLQSFTIGALVTSWEINIQRLPLVSRLFHDVARGVSIGEALALHLASEEARGHHHKLCLIGDPAIRLPPSEIHDPLEGIQALTKPPPPSDRCMAGLGLLRLMIHQYAQEGADSSNILPILAGYESMLASGRQHDIELAHRFRRGMVSFLASQDTMLSKTWTQFTLATQSLPNRSACSVCGRRTVERVYSLRIPGAVARVETMCPSCGSIEDCPVDRRMSMRVESSGLIQLSGALPDSQWWARVTIERFFTQETHGWDWPPAATGEPLSHFQVPTPWPTVPFRLSVILVYGSCEFSVLGCLFRQTHQNVAAN